MNLKKKRIYPFMMALTFSMNSYSVSSELDKAYELYNLGDYTKALEEFSKVDTKKDKDLQAELFFWQGVTYNKLQEFDKAVRSFNEAVKLGYDEEELHYEFAQALYSTQELEKAIVQFKLSIEEEENETASEFYVAYISQILEKYPQAINYYEKIVQKRGSDKSLKQSSKFNLANIEFEIMDANDKIDQKDKIEQVRLSIIPAMLRALNMDNKSTIANDIVQKIKAIKKKYDIKPLKMANGRIIPDKHWKVRLTETIDYDSNVTLEGDEFVPKSTDIDSIVNTTELLGKYRYIIQDKYTLNPELRVNKTFHSQRENTAVNQNDSYNLAGALRTSYDHLFKGKIATALLDLSYNYTARDYQSNGDIIFYGRNIGLSAGERVEWFDFGPTTLKFRINKFTGHSTNLDYMTFGLFGLQTYKRANNHRMIFIGSLTLKDAELKTDSKNSLLLKSSYIIPGLFKNTIFSGGLGLTLTDTKEQSDDRGMEMKLEPGFKLTKRINNYLDATLKYDYTYNSSKDKVNYQYTKHVLGAEFKLEF